MIFEEFVNTKLTDNLSLIPHCGFIFDPSEDFIPMHITKKTVWHLARHNVLSIEPEQNFVKYSKKLHIIRTFIY